MASNIIGWIFGILFIVIGVLNIALVHVVPGIFYLSLSLVFLPPAVTYTKHKTGFILPMTARVITGFIILWGTLAVGDLAEILGL